MIGIIDFRKASGENVPDIVKYVKDYVNTHSNIQVIVTTDSQTKGSKTCFCNLIAHFSTIFFFVEKYLYTVATPTSDFSAISATVTSLIERLRKRSHESFIIKSSAACLILFIFAPFLCNSMQIKLIYWLSIKIISLLKVVVNMFLKFFITSVQRRKSKLNNNNENDRGRREFFPLPHFFIIEIIAQKTCMSVNIDFVIFAW